MDGIRLSPENWAHESKASWMRLEDKPKGDDRDALEKLGKLDLSDVRIREALEPSVRVACDRCDRFQSYFNQDEDNRARSARAQDYAGTQRMFSTSWENVNLPVVPPRLVPGRISRYAYLDDIGRGRVDTTPNDLAATYLDVEAALEWQLQTLRRLAPPDEMARIAARLQDDPAEVLSVMRSLRVRVPDPFLRPIAIAAPSRRMRRRHDVGIDLQSRTAHVGFTGLAAARAPTGPGRHRRVDAVARNRAARANLPSP